MAWNPSPKVADAREIARKWKMRKVIIIGLDQPRGTFEVASYGQTREECAEARDLCEQIAGMLEVGTLRP